MLLLIWGNHMRLPDTVPHSLEVWQTKLSIYQYILTRLWLTANLNPNRVEPYSCDAVLRQLIAVFGQWKRWTTHLWSSVYENHVFQWFVISSIVSLWLFIYTPYVHSSTTQSGFPSKIEGVIQGYITSREEFIRMKLHKGYITIGRRRTHLQNKPTTNIDSSHRI